MNTPHPLGVLAASQASFEAVDPKFVKAGLQAAQDKTKVMFEMIKHSLKEGTTETDAKKLTLDLF